MSPACLPRLNESPSGKEGKSQNMHQTHWMQEVPQ